MNHHINGENYTRTPFFALFLAYGFSLFLIWFYGLLFVFPLTLATPDASSSGFFGEYVAGLFGLAMGIVFSRFLFSHRFDQVLAVLSGIMAICIAVMLFGFIVFNTESFYMHPMSFILGSITGYMLSVWIQALTTFASPLTPYLFALSALLALLTCYFLSTLITPAFVICVIAALGLSVMALAYIKRHYPEHRKEASELVSGERLFISSKIIIQFSIYGLLFGVALCLLSTFGSLKSISIALMVGIVIAALDIWHSNGVNMKRSRNATSIALMTILLLAAFLWPEAQLVCWSAITTVFAYVFLINANWVILSAREHKQSALCLYAQTQGGFWACFVLGWSGAFVLYINSLNTLIMICALLFLLAVSSLLAAMTNFGPFEFVQAQIENARGTPSHDKSHQFIQACNEIALSHGLTPRESEVFSLLAKGRNAQVISNDLVISRYTAKTHIYHIYQKTGKGSQQDIIDMVEVYFRQETRSA